MNGRYPAPRLAGLALAALLALSGVQAAPETGPLGQSLVRPSDGTRVKLVAGAPALHVVFFAIWCPPCLEELEQLTELEIRFGERGYRLVLVPVQNRHSVERLREFREEYPTPGELLFDLGGEAEAAATVDGLPNHLVFDASGDLVHRSGAFDDGVREAVEALLDATRPGGARR
jgi:thiol-disulfide isomerase/thioredoxin